MEIKPYLILTTFDQLKMLSDPLRTKLLLLLIEKPYSGQELSKELNIPRQKVHYHLGELEKHGIIHLVSEEKKRNMVEKKYRAVAQGFIPGKEVLPYFNEIGEGRRQTTLALIDRTKSRVLAAPHEAFQVDSTNTKKWPGIISYTEVRTSREKWENWLQKYHQLLEELESLQDDSGEWFSMTSLGFKLSEPTLYIETKESSQTSHLTNKNKTEEDHGSN